jgi:hypothetical protein
VAEVCVGELAPDLLASLRAKAPLPFA